MGRPSKTGLDYFPMDVDFDADDKIYMIEAKHRDGYKIIVKLLAEVYRHGYFKTWSERDLLVFAGKKGIPAEDVRGVVETALEGGFFSREQYEINGILTSAGIQQRYVFGAMKRRKIRLDPHYCLLSPADFPSKLAEKLSIEVCVETNRVSGTETKAEEPSGTQIQNENENEKERLRTPKKAPETPPPDPPPGPEPAGSPRAGPQFELACAWGRIHFERTTIPFNPLEEHFAQAAKLLRLLGGDLGRALEASRRYFDEDWWFTRDKQTRKPSYSFGGFCAHASEILASNGRQAGRGPPARACPVCGCQVVGSMQSCGECGMEVSKFGDREAVEEHKRWRQERLETSRRNAQS